MPPTDTTGYEIENADHLWINIFEFLVIDTPNQQRI